jgi:hypothetical protein
MPGGDPGGSPKMKTKITKPIPPIVPSPIPPSRAPITMQAKSMRSSIHIMIAPLILNENHFS